MLSMWAYAPVRANSQDADDDMALDFQGTKRWLTSETIDSLSTLCLLTSKRAKQWKAQIAAALIETSEKVVDHMNQHRDDDFASIAKRMIELWAVGLETFDMEAAKRVKETASGW